MDQSEIQKKVEAFLKELEVPSFIVFGFQKGKSAEGKDKAHSTSSGRAEFGIVSSYNKVPPQAVIKGMSWALNDFINKSL
ncbi:MAG: hypothetical protein QF741_03830 [Candidatus Peribacteraceae bacterium]|jgi:hypothetical protein|nr:hypothetical protein [Candidatus Peribacteraceae bacterium]MDP7454886.1 hypothetical protein [Candidatus Peribacteraceae bacterium]MDP7646176.1 hypothetical protein [Candidatus Peribacteraceae bacterium]|tara:strand:+ start:544 stop:783 length:240 start_codon:yes stop_codon:yes gene_type:complete